MGKKNKKKNNNYNRNNVSNNNVVKLNNIAVKNEEPKIILTQNQQDELNMYIFEQKQKADNYYKEKKESADKLSEEIRVELENDFKKRVEAEVYAKTQNLKLQEDRLTNDLEKYNKDVAALEEEKNNYKKEQLEIVKQEMTNIVKEKEKIEDENNELIKNNRKLEAQNKSLIEDAGEYREELKRLSKNEGNNMALQNKVDSLEEELKVIKSMYNEKAKELSKLESLLVQCNNNPDEIIKMNSFLSKENKELKDSLANYPSKEELKVLRETKEQYNSHLDKYEKMHMEKNNLQLQNFELRLANSKLENTKKSLELLSIQKEELEKELNRTMELYNTNVDSVFATLSKIDEEKFTFPDNIDITLKDLCEHFRGYLQNRNKNPLYYDNQTIRSFIAGLASSRTMILEGLSGTGKTRLPMSFGDFAHAKVKVISVQSSWKDRNDLLGYYNDFKKQYKETEFLKAVYEACCDLDNIYLIVLDEMNLSRIEYYFADFLSVLEKDEEQWEIDLISDYASISNNGKYPKKIHEGKLKLGNNIWFIGTANKDDSTFMISDKVYDRSTVIYFDKKGEKDQLLKSFPEIDLNKETLLRLFNNASKFENPTDEERFKKMIKNLDDGVKELFEITFGNRIENQLEKFVPAYVKCGGTVDEALDVVFSRKILRKLEGIYDDNTKENLEELKEYISYNEYKMPMSEKTIKKLIETK